MGGFISTFIAGHDGDCLAQFANGADEMVSDHGELLKLYVDDFRAVGAGESISMRRSQSCSYQRLLGRRVMAYSASLEVWKHRLRDRQKIF